MYYRTQKLNVHIYTRKQMNNFLMYVKKFFEALSDLKDNAMCQTALHITL